MLQIRITNADGSDPIILEKADNKERTIALDSSNEGISFTISKMDPKSEYLNPDNDATYQRLWECWDTETGKRKSHGPITEIDDDSGTYTVKGKGPSQFLVDMVKSTRTFYTSLGEVVDSLRYENIAALPKTSTLVSDPAPTPMHDPYIPGIFGDITVNEKYYALSKLSKDMVTDDFDGVNYGAQDVEPSNNAYTTNQFWAGMSKNDSIIIDLGEVTSINKLEISFPWWGGISKKYDRSYSFEVAYAIEGDNTVQGRPFGTFTTLLTSTNPYITEPGKFVNIYTGDTTDTFNAIPLYTASGMPDIQARYIRIHIIDVGAWYMGQDKGDFSKATTYDIGDVVRSTNPNGDDLALGVTWVDESNENVWTNNWDTGKAVWTMVASGLVAFGDVNPSGSDIYPPDSYWYNRAATTLWDSPSAGMWTANLNFVHHSRQPFSLGYWISTIPNNKGSTFFDS